MLNLLLLIAFLALSTVSYLVGNVLFWSVMLAIEVLIAVAAPPLRRQGARFIVLLWFMLFTLVVSFLMNFLLDALDSALLYTIRLAAVSLFSVAFCMLYKLGRLKSALICALKPMRLVNESLYFRLSKIITIGISLIPLVADQFTGIARALKAKGLAVTPRSILQRPTVIINVLVYWLLDFATDLERALIAKGV